MALVETAAALAQAARLGRMTTAQRDLNLREFDSLWEQVDDMAVDDALVREAAALTAHHSLWGYGAVHCAAALRLADDDVVAVTGDRSLLTAWMAEGLAVIDTQA